MLANIINNAYRVVQNLYVWYWSPSTQTTLANYRQTVIEVLAVLYLVLSQCYMDWVGLNDLWLTLSLHHNAFVITPEEGDTGWFDVWTMVQGDLTYATTWLEFTLHDIRNATIELYYRVRTVL